MSGVGPGVEGDVAAGSRGHGTGAGGAAEAAGPRSLSTQASGAPEGAVEHPRGAASGVGVDQQAAASGMGAVPTGGAASELAGSGRDDATASGPLARELVLIGIGAGDPEWLTLAAVRAIGELDVLFVVVKEDEYDEPVRFRRELVARHRADPVRTVELRDPARPWRTTADYPAAVARWREQRRALWSDAVASELRAGETGGFLVWGDPSLYESTLAIVSEVVAAAPEDRPVRCRVIPGVSAVTALAARHGIPLNRQGGAVQITPARRLERGLPADVDDVVVMLDAHQTFARIDPDGWDIYWGAYLGTPDELLIAGPLEDVRDEILRVRADAAARKGWMFDTYVLRRRTPTR